MFLTNFNMPRLQWNLNHYNSCIFIEGYPFAFVNSYFFMFLSKLSVIKENIPLYATLCLRAFSPGKGIANKTSKVIGIK